jgi:hypothetical protein
MKLKELEDVLLATRLPLTMFSNRLRWGECATLVTVSFTYMRSEADCV